MASVRTNITNALSWFYERLTKRDLDPIRASISQSDLLKTVQVNMLEHPEYVDEPELLFGSSYVAYILLLQDESGTSSVFGLSAAMIIGFTQNVSHGAQIRIGYSGDMYYRTRNTGWSDWQTLEGTT